MNAAQIAHVALIVVFLVTGAVLLTMGHTFAGPACMAASAFGWLVLIAMVVSDASTGDQETTNGTSVPGPTADSE